MRIERCSMVALARLAPAKPPTYRYSAAKSEMTSQPRRESLYNSANTKRYVAEALAGAGSPLAGPRCDCTSETATASVMPQPTRACISY